MIKPSKLASSCVLALKAKELGSSAAYATHDVPRFGVVILGRNTVVSAYNRRRYRIWPCSHVSAGAPRAHETPSGHDVHVSQEAFLQLQWELSQQGYAFPIYPLRIPQHNSAIQCVRTPIPSPRGSAQTSICAVLLASCAKLSRLYPTNLGHGTSLLPTRLQR